MTIQHSWIVARSLNNTRNKEETRQLHVTCEEKGNNNKLKLIS